MVGSKHFSLRSMFTRLIKRFDSICTQYFTECHFSREYLAKCKTEFYLFQLKLVLFYSLNISDAKYSTNGWLKNVSLFFFAKFNFFCHKCTMYIHRRERKYFFFLQRDAKRNWIIKPFFFSSTLSRLHNTQNKERRRKKKKKKRYKLMKQRATQSHKNVCFMISKQKKK